VWSAPCIRRRGARIFWFSLKTKVDGFSRFGLKTSGYGFSQFDLKTSGYGFFRFGLKTGGYGSCGLTSKPLAQVSQFEPQNWQRRFSDLTHKITTIVSWFVPQNLVGYGLLVAPQN
jgi:hypothetical protein